MNWRGKRVLVTGASGFVGSNLIPLLLDTGAEVIGVRRSDYDLLEQVNVRRMLDEVRPQVVFHLAALSAGILENIKRPADFFYQNLLMGTMMMHESWQRGVEKYITLMGGCSYPSDAPNPISEGTLHRGYPQPESAPYSLAKSMSFVGAQSYRKQFGFNAIVLVPGNLYGPYDNFDLNQSHVIPALIRKFCEAHETGAQEVVVWGSGKALRDFVYIEDACKGIMRAATIYDGDQLINISSGQETSITTLATTIAEVVGYTGRIIWDTSRPEGQMRKIYDVQRMRDLLQLECDTSLRDGLAKTVEWLRANRAIARTSVAPGSVVETAGVARD
jgi:GDP-L-fucose synthase